MKRRTAEGTAGWTGALGDAEEIRAHLLAAARAGRSLTYSELLEYLGFGFSRPKMRALCVTLGVIDREAAERGEPELAVLVVRQSDGLPGQGWWVAGGAADHGYEGAWEGAAAKQLVERLQQAAFRYWAERSLANGGGLG